MSEKSTPAGDDAPQQHSTSPAEEAPTGPGPAEGGSTPENRQDLTNKARAFLASPQVRHEDIPAKRRFLAEKGLTDLEIDQLVQELLFPARFKPPQVPSIPPRTYPQPPPSNLPNLLVGVLRIFTWVVGSSAALLFVYFRHILPRLESSFRARNALQNHQRDLLGKLTTSLTSLRSTQTESFATLPYPKLPVLRLDSEFAACNSIDELKSKFEVQKKDIPPFTLLRCALSSGIEEPTTEGLFKIIEDQFPHFNLSQNVQLQEKLWQTLTTVPLFHHHDAPQSEHQPTWSYSEPEPAPPTQYLTSLTNLKHALPPPASISPSSTPAPSRFQHTLQSLMDFTGYLTTETYPLPFSTSSYRPGAAPNGGYGNNSPLSNAQQEDLRKEIRALKGLALNRRTFTLPRPPSATQLQQSTPS